MGYDVKKILLSLRIQYYLPFVLVSGYFLWYPEPQKVQANQDIDPLPVVDDSDPSTWPQPAPLPAPEDASSLTETTEPINLPVELRSPVIEDATQSAPANLVSPVPAPSVDTGVPLTVEKSPDENFRAPFPSSSSSPSVPATVPTVGGMNRTSQNEAIPIPRGDIALPRPTIPQIISPYESDEYRLTVGDTISVFAANIPEFTTENILRSDGSINLPVAGEIFLWDMTLDEAERAITKHYVDAKVLQKPDISVKLLASSPLKIAIAGEINRPGAYDVPVLDKKLPTITDAIKAAGGLSGEADLRNVEVYRHNRVGGQELIKLNLFSLLKEADLSQNVTLRSGDRIIIPNAPLRPEEAQLIGSANISPDAMQVGILGEVLSPGLIQAPTNTSLNQALILVGGFNSRAKKTVQLVRTNEDGSVTREKIKIDWAANIGDDKNPILQHRDVVLVGPNAIAKYTDFLDKAIGPINRTIPFIGILDLLFPSNNNR